METVFFLLVLKFTYVSCGCGLQYQVQSDNTCNRVRFNLPTTTDEGDVFEFYCYSILADSAASDNCPAKVCQASDKWTAATISCGESECYYVSSSYRGLRTCTDTAKVCQHWNSQTPNPHSYTDPAMYPDASVEDASNYCRDPDGVRGAPWCYIAESATGWEYCGVKQCTKSDCYTDPSAYVGRQTCTENGRTCQRWEHQSPHSHGYYSFNMFPDVTVADAQNYCRDPDGARGAPWCYTMDASVEWEFCAIPTCRSLGVGTGSCIPTVNCGNFDYTIESDNLCNEFSYADPANNEEGEVIRFSCDTLLYGIMANGYYCPVKVCDASGSWTSADISCGETECYSDSSLYRGTRGCTVSGKTCQRWDSQKPTPHAYVSASQFPEELLGSAMNYCRDPGNLRGAPGVIPRILPGNGNSATFQPVTQSLSTAVPVQKTTVDVSISKCSLMTYVMMLNSSCRPPTARGKYSASTVALLTGVTGSDYCPAKYCDVYGSWSSSK
ncbi:hypothetical protein ScPMuIL_002625 [Solemya velum]